MILPRERKYVVTHISLDHLTLMLLCFPYCKNVPTLRVKEKIFSNLLGVRSFSAEPTHLQRICSAKNHDINIPTPTLRGYV